MEQEAELQGAKTSYLFTRERDGWVMECPGQGSEALAKKLTKNLYRHRASLIDPYLESYFREFTACRDICMWWKHYLCTDHNVFRFGPYDCSQGFFQWEIMTNPKWRKRCYIVKSFGEGNSAEDLFAKMEKPAKEEPRYMSEAIPGNLANQSI